MAQEPSQLNREQKTANPFTLTSELLERIFEALKNAPKIPAKPTPETQVQLAEADAQAAHKWHRPLSDCTCNGWSTNGCVWHTPFKASA